MKVRKIQLILITGIVWAAVSVMLMKRAIDWFAEFAEYQMIIAISFTVIVAFVKTRFIFIKVTNENIARIMKLKGHKVSAFAFHTLKFYLLIVLMIGGGTLLRNLEFIPKYTLFPVYAGVSLAMFYASILYFIYYRKN
jgi:hypothetical protein